jgi:hypothetical protein
MVATGDRELGMSGERKDVTSPEAKDIHDAARAADSDHDMGGLLVLLPGLRFRRRGYLVERCSCGD